MPAGEFTCLGLGNDMPLTAWQTCCGAREINAEAQSCSIMMLAWDVEQCSLQVFL